MVNISAFPKWLQTVNESRSERSQSAKLLLQLGYIKQSIQQISYKKVSSDLE